MLFKQVHLEGIRNGTVSLAFRRWPKAAAKTGSVIKTSIGLVKLGTVRTVPASSITAAQAKSAGYANKETLLQELNSRTGDIYQIAVQYEAPDPRIALRAQKTMPKEELTSLKAALERLDKFSRTGPWTKDILIAIRDHPGLRAADLAAKTGTEKEWLKPHIRKLKEHGLTISLEIGYELSPRGKALLKAWMS